MVIKEKILILVSIPIAIIFLCAYTSQYLALIYLRSYNQGLQDNLFQTQIAFTKNFTQILTQQLNFEVQKYSCYVNLINRYISQIINDRVLFKEPHRSTFMHIETKYTRSEDPEILKLYDINPLHTNVWYHKNITNQTLLDNEGKELLRNMSRLYLLQRAIEYENNFNNYSNNRKLKFYDAFIGYQYQGMLTNSAINTTLKFLKWSPECGNGLLYQYDPRCRFWFKQTLKYETLIFMEPNLIFSKDVPYVGSTVCQKLYKFNYEIKQKELFSVLCIDIQLISMQNYFQNFAKSTKQFYLIEPRSQKILYNSNQLMDPSNITIYNFNQVELINLQSKSDALLLNNTISQYFTTWVNETQQQIFIEKSPLLQTRNKQINYNRNGTQTTVILSPVTIIDKTPKYQGYQNWDQGNTAKFNIETPYLQINIITNEDLKSESKKVEEFFQRFFIIVSILLGVLALISILVTIFYSLRIRHMLNKSIESLTFILEQLNDKDIRDNIFSNYVEEMLLSKEARKLYESFKGIYQILLTTSENFFQDNETITLLKLNKNIEFFKQFGNVEAVGVTLNNIGSILLSQNHYLQALDSFQQSIIYAKYQINEFCKNNPNSVSSHLLADYSYDTKFYLYINKLKNVQTPQQADISGSINLKKLSDFNKSQISTQVKSRYSNNQQQIPSKVNSSQIYNSFSQINQKEQNNRTSFFKGQISDNKLLQGFNKTFISNRLKQYSQDQGIKLSFTKYQSEEYYEQRIELLSNLYFRKKNYIIALIAFQENTQQINNSINKKIANYKSNKLYSQQSNQNININNNFWYETKQLLNELILINKQLPFGESQEPEIYSMISKCYYQLNKEAKSKKIINQCENLLNQLNKSYPVLQQCNQQSPLIEYTVDNQKNKQQIEIQPELSSRQSFNSTLRNKIIQNNDQEPLQNQIQIIQSINQQRQIVNKYSYQQENFQSEGLFSNKQKMPNQKNQGNDIQQSEQQKYSQELINNQQQNNIFSCTKNLNQINPSSPYNSFQISHKPSQLQGDNQIYYLNSDNELNQKEETQNLFSSQNFLTVSGVTQNKNNLGNSFKAQEIKKQFQFSKKLLAKSQQISSSKQNQTPQSNLLNEQAKSENKQLIEYPKIEIASNQQINDNQQIQETIYQNEDHFAQKLQDLQKSKQMELLVDKKQKFDQISSKPYEQSGLEELFKYNRQVNNIIQEEYQLLNYLSIHTQDLIIKFTKSQLLLKQKNYKQAASILTNLVENKKYLMSYYPYKIFNLLKYIFDQMKVRSKEINLIVQKFNPDISIQIAMVIACFSHHKQIFKSTQLASNLVSNVLVKNQDQFGLVLVDKSDNYIQIYMTLTKVNQIKDIMNKIIKDILQSTSTKTVDSFYQLYSLTQISQELHNNEEKQYSKDILNCDITQNLNQENEQNDTQQLKQPQKINQEQESSSINCIFSQNMPQENQQDKNYQQITEENDFSNNSQSSNYHIDQIGQTKYGSEFPISIEKKKQSFKVILPNIGDIQDMINSSPGKKNFEDQELNFSSDQFEIRNQIFHISIRKTLSKLFSLNPFIQKYLLKCQKGLDFLENNLEEDEICNTQCKYTSKQKKFIIYSTDKISISRNQLFKKLCQVLYYLNVELIIFSFTKSSNFLEDSPDSSYVFQDKDIIKIFYSNERIQNYIQNQRDKYWKQENPTIIQHF